MKMKRLKNYIKKWGFAGLGLYKGVETVQNLTGL
jgi:uncharacterized membrane protein